MTFFNPAEPIIRSKQESLDFQDRQGLIHFHLRIRNKTLFSMFYTRIDQVFLLWGLISAAIFISAQFIHLSWVIQAGYWSALTLIGTVGMVALTHFWVKVERLQWVLYCWVILMLGGVVLTDLSIFLGWGEVLMRLCPLWLGLIAFGYFCTGVGMRSRAFITASLVHLLGIATLHYVGGWQFLATGIVMAVSLLIFAGVQWDMRPPIEYNLLTLEQKQFNEKQYQLRQASLSVSSL
ncbi:MAG TPA: hypothetical protein V6D37_15520 [Candidatus Sericytochromatia bacterium]|jgi:hypothetical protein